MKAKIIIGIAAAGVVILGLAAAASAATGPTMARANNGPPPPPPPPPGGYPGNPNLKKPEDYSISVGRAVTGYGRFVTGHPEAVKDSLVYQIGRSGLHYLKKIF